MAVTCDLGPLISAYLDGELHPGELEIVAAHLEVCTDCIAEFHDVKAARTAVKLLPPVDPPEWLEPFGHLGDSLSALLDGEIALRDDPIMARHLRSCDWCREELAIIDAARTAVRSLPALTPPEEALTPPAGNVVAVLPRRRVLAAAGIAAAAVLAVTMVGRGPAPQRVDLHDLADRHVARASVEAGFTVTPVVAPGGAP